MTSFFDRYKWNPQRVQTPEELESALECFAVRGKKIKAIHCIGMAENMNRQEYEQAADKQLLRAGVPYDALRENTYPWYNRILLPCEVCICEPVVLVFEDDSTLEIRPSGDHGLFLATNQIGPSIVDGLNHSNFDASVLFDRVLGTSIRRTTTIHTSSKTFSTNSAHLYIANDMRWHFSLTKEDCFFDCGLLLRGDSCGQFHFGITERYSDNKPAKIDYATIQRAAKPVFQRPIIEGGGLFSIVPIRLPADPESIHRYPSREALEKCLGRNHMISMEEEDILDFLYYFLDKYFDESCPHEVFRDCCQDERFAWYDYTLYSYDAMHAMLDEIERCALLLKTDFDNPVLTQIKENFEPCIFDPDNYYSSKYFSPDEAAQLIRQNIGLAIDFYERLVRRVRGMLRCAVDYEFIAFIGP